MTRVRPLPGFLLVVLVPLSFVACQPIDCTPSVTEALDGAVLDIGDLERSSVLQAHLGSSGEPLADRRVEFSLEYEDQSRFLGSSQTAEDGMAQFDLKRLDLTLAQVVTEAALRETSFRAQFRRDRTHCGSEGLARIHVVAAP